jgi:hypothetical protein
MITRIDFSDEPLEAGRSRKLRAWTNDAPLSVAIECFREPPTPAQLRSCDECGSFRITSGETIFIAASLSAFKSGAGYLLVRVTDAGHDFREFRIEISHTEGGANMEGGLHA